MSRRTYDRQFCHPRFLFQPWIVRLLRLLDRMNTKFLNAWWFTGRRSRGRLDTCPHKAGLPCPLASAAENSGPDILSEAHLRLRDSKGCCFIPSRSEISGETRRSFYFPRRRGIVHRRTNSSCSGASKKTGASSGRTVPFRRNPEQQYFNGK